MNEHVPRFPVHFDLHSLFLHARYLNNFRFIFGRCLYQLVVNVECVFDVGEYRSYAYFLILSFDHLHSPSHHHVSQFSSHAVKDTPENLGAHSILHIYLGVNEVDAAVNCSFT